jgi:hemoglobin-like flavoprotein
MTIQESIHRILGQRETLADLFYQVFLEDYPEVRRHFDSINMREQSTLLTMALLVMERHYVGSYPATANYLRYLGTQHRQRGIPPELFPHFQAALLRALERFHGQDWSAELAAQWEEAIDRCTRAMLEGYQHHFAV